MNTKNTNNFLDHELDINKYINKLISNYKIFITTIFLFGLLAVSLTFFLPKKYMSQATLSNSSFFDFVSSSQSNSGGSLNLGSLSSIIPGATSGESDMLKIIKISQSRDFVLNFVEKHNIKEIIKFKNKNIDDLVYEEFLKLLSLSIDEDTNLVSISFVDYSPSNSESILNKYISEINFYFAQKDINFANEIIPSLMEERSTAMSVDLKQILDGFIFKYVRMKTLAEVGDEYVFEIINKPYSPSRHFFPRKSVFAILGLLLGAILSFIYIVIFVREE